jgi:hypothetical protein
LLTADPCTRSQRYFEAAGIAAAARRFVGTARKVKMPWAQIRRLALLSCILRGLTAPTARGNLDN